MGAGEETNCPEGRKRLELTEDKTKTTVVVGFRVYESKSPFLSTYVLEVTLPLSFLILPL